jgi:hypothetical protein
VGRAMRLAAEVYLTAFASGSCSTCDFDRRCDPWN